ncbi:MAG: hypothetical protein EOR60_15385 [Mesorhizobium sp.]|nr:MAG: hypothetical protein EOR60_15385 [Mesorhizobium sp.]
MPNNPVRATAEGMPVVNRRKAIAISGFGAVLATLAASTIKSPASPVTASLEDALAACRSAEGAYSACLAKENAIADALGDALFPEWTPPRGLIWLPHSPKAYRSSKELAAFLVDKTAKVQKSFEEGMLARPAYDRWVADIQRCHEGVASLRDQEAAIAAAGYHDASEAADEALSVATEAWEDVLAHPCASFAEVQAKVDFVILYADKLGWSFEHEEAMQLLASLAGREA